MDYHTGVGVMPWSRRPREEALVEDPKQRLGYNGVEEIKAHAFEGWTGRGFGRWRLPCPSR